MKKGKLASILFTYNFYKLPISSAKSGTAAHNDNHVFRILANDGWFPLDGNDQNQIYSPTMTINRAKTIERTRKFGLTDEDESWFNGFNGIIDYKQSIKVTIYCKFEFQSYPFDSHTCDFIYIATAPVKYLLLNSSEIRYQNVENQKEIIQVEQSDLPFHVELESLEQFNSTLTGNNYSSTGMRIHIERNNLGLLIGGYYGPTTIFVLLSLVSYSIDADMVSLKQFHLI